MVIRRRPSRAPLGSIVAAVALAAGSIGSVAWLGMRTLVPLVLGTSPDTDDEAPLAAMFRRWVSPLLGFEERNGAGTEIDGLSIKLSREQHGFWRSAEASLLVRAKAEREVTHVELFDGDDRDGDGRIECSEWKCVWSGAPEPGASEILVRPSGGTVEVGGETLRVVVSFKNKEPFWVQYGTGDLQCDDP